MALPKEPRQKMINMMYLVLTAFAGTECICRNPQTPSKTVKQKYRQR